MVYIHIYAQTQHWVYTTNPKPPARTTPSPASLPPPGDYLNPLLPGVGGTGAPAPFISFHCFVGAKDQNDQVSGKDPQPTSSWFGPF